MTPWQARFVVIGFLVIGAGIAANLLMLQEAPIATSAIKPKPARAVPAKPVQRADTAAERGEPKVAPGSKEAKPARAATGGKGGSAPRKPVAKSARDAKGRRTASTGR